MNRNRALIQTLSTSLIAACAALIITGCGGTQQDAAPTTDESAAQTSAAPGDTTLPDTLFLTEAPTEVASLLEARQSAAVGDEVAFAARIGGRVDPFTKQAAVFLVADRAVPTCVDKHGPDGCPTPWDYCCEPKDNLLANLATVQIVDADGRPLRTSARGVRGLDPMADIIVVGTVRTADPGAFVINATAIYIEQG